MAQRPYGIAGTSALKLVQTRAARFTKDKNENVYAGMSGLCSVRTFDRQSEDLRRDTFFTRVTCVFVMLIAMAMIATGEVADWRVSCAIQERGLEVICVKQGDTLWSIACTHAIDGCSAMEVLRWVQGHNGLLDARICVGQKLEVPSVVRFD